MRKDWTGAFIGLPPSSIIIHCLFISLCLWLVNALIWLLLCLLSPCALNFGRFLPTCMIIFFFSSSHNTSLSHTFNWPPHDLQSQALNCTQSDFCLWTLRGTNGAPPGCDIRRQTGRKKRERERRRVDSVQHKCRLSDLPLMRRHLRQEGRRKLLLWKTHRWACHAKKKGWGESWAAFWELTRRRSKGSNNFTSHTYACLR